MVNAGYDLNGHNNAAGCGQKARLYSEVEPITKSLAKTIKSLGFKKVGL